MTSILHKILFPTDFSIPLVGSLNPAISGKTLSTQTFCAHIHPTSQSLIHPPSPPHSSLSLLLYFLPTLAHSQSHLSTAGSPPPFLLIHSDLIFPAQNEASSVSLRASASRMSFSRMHARFCHVTSKLLPI